MSTLVLGIFNIILHFLSWLRKNLFTNLEIVQKAVLYFILISIALLYLQPVFYMISMAFSSFADMTDPTTKWIPKNGTWDNIRYSLQQMKVIPILSKSRGLWRSLMDSSLFVSIITALPAALIQVVTCAIAGYGFAKLNFPLKKLMIVFLISSIIIPPQIIFMPLVWLFKDLHLVNTPWAFIVPALFGNGLKGGLFVIIYMQFFRKIPKELEEAALLDGASYYQIFGRIMFPLSKPAKITVLLFSLVWHWNETYLTTIFYPSVKTMSTIIAGVQLQYADTTMSILPVKMASTVLSIIPILFMYFFTQKHFTESIERTGIVE